MAARKTFNYGKPARTAVPVVRQLFEAIAEGELMYGEVADKALVAKETLSYWKHGVHTPNVVEFERVARAIGYRLVLEPVEKKTAPGGETVAVGQVQQIGEDLRCESRMA